MDDIISEIFERCAKSNNGCIEYQTKSPSKRINGKMVSFARIIYESFIGELPYRSSILRSCNNGKCLNPNHMLPSTPEDKFWSHVKKTSGCWVWVGSKDGGGYGCFGSSWLDERKSHRISWIIYNGEIPPDFWVLHKCDNPSCVNPEHLYLGTHQDNVQDKIKRERQSRMIGMRNGRSILTPDDVIEMRKMYKRGDWSYRQLSWFFGVSQTQVARIMKKESWSWLD